MIRVATAQEATKISSLYDITTVVTQRINIKMEAELKTILLIENDVGCLESVAGILNRLGYAVIAMQNGPTSLCVLREGMPIDLVITADQIDDMDGFEMIAAIKKISPLIPVIMISSDISIEAYLRALSLGAYEYLNKPVQTKEISRAVKGANEKVLIGGNDHSIHRDILLKDTA